MPVKGTIKNVQKGYAFAAGDDRVDYFVHHSAVRNVKLDELRPGDRIEFEPGRGDRGPRAEEVYLDEAVSATR